jgi:rubrerythrin
MANSSVSPGLAMAMATEKEGVEIYSQASQRTLYPLGQRMFASLAEDEKCHLLMIQRLADGLGIQAALDVSREGRPIERVKSAFAEVGQAVVDDLSVCADDLEALRLAMDFEVRGYKAYDEAAKKAPNEAERQLFKKLCEEENEHHKMLENVYEYLADNWHWFLWKEDALLDGG